MMMMIMMMMMMIMMSTIILMILNIVHMTIRIFLQVICYGQIIGGIIAEDRETAQRAADMVSIEYEELTPILTIEVSLLKKIFLKSNSLILSS
jgi:xanthine dehydrogenase molybdopterin-binding subunit B